MLNQLVLLGKVKKIVGDTIIIVNDDIDFLINVSSETMENAKDYIRQGDLIGIKGKLGKNNCIICDRLTFLSSKKED